MSQGPIKFRLFSGVRQRDRRNVGILEGHEELDTGKGIASLKPNQKRDLQSRVQHWLDGADGPENYFHNFPGDTICPACFVFKVGDHRFYGYLCHPLSKNPALQVCTLCSHAMKHRWETDPAEKTLVKRWSLNHEAKAAIMEELEKLEKEKKSKDAKNKKGESPWIN